VLFSLCLLVFVALVAVEPLNSAPAGVAGAGVEGLDCGCEHERQQATIPIRYPVESALVGEVVLGPCFDVAVASAPPFPFWAEEFGGFGDMSGAS
jgi:hypothetical protein